MIGRAAPIFSTRPLSVYQRLSSVHRPAGSEVAPTPADWVELSGPAPQAEIKPVEPPKIGGTVVPEWAREPLEFSWTGVSDEEFAQRMESIEKALSDPFAEAVEDSVRLGDYFTNRVYLVKLNNGLVGIWKPEYQSRDRAERKTIPNEEEFRREALGYSIDKAMGHLGRTPPSVYREFDGRKGVLQLFLPGASVGGDLTPEKSIYKDIAVYDHAAGNLDRHDHNWITLSDGSIVPIDHGLILPENNTTLTPHNFYLNQTVVLDERHKKAVRGLLDALPGLKKEAEELGLKPAAMEALEHRATAMLLSGQTSNFWRGGDDYPIRHSDGAKYVPPAQEALLAS